jgi:hypothetical protein
MEFSLTPATNNNKLITFSFENKHIFNSHHQKNFILLNFVKISKNHI